MKKVAAHIFWILVGIVGAWAYAMIALYRREGLLAVGGRPRQALADHVLFSYANQF